MFLEPGEIVLRRHFQHDAVNRVAPCHVVRHDERGLLLWAGVGHPYWDLNTLDDLGPRDLPLPAWLAAPKAPAARTNRVGLLLWHPAGEAYSIWFFFSAGGVFSNWYANLEAPGVIWRAAGVTGLDTVDWDLDLWIRADLSWNWKDAEEFAERLAYGGQYWVPDEAAVWAAGHRVLARLEAREFPFDGTWCDFTPDASWSVPDGLPTGWDRPRAVGSRPDGIGAGSAGAGVGAAAEPPP